MVLHVVISVIFLMLNAVAESKIEAQTSSAKTVAKVGSDVSLWCNATGYPKPVVYWTREDRNRRLPDGNQQFWVSSDLQFNCLVSTAQRWKFESHSIIADVILAVTAQSKIEKRAIRFKDSKLWNNLPTNIKETQSRFSFKYNIKDYLLQHLK